MYRNIMTNLLCRPLGSEQFAKTQDSVTSNTVQHQIKTFHVSLALTRVGHYMITALWYVLREHTQFLCLCIQTDVEIFQQNLNFSPGADHIRFSNKD